jgi:hypothetical protein
VAVAVDCHRQALAADRAVHVAVAGAAYLVESECARCVDYEWMR